MTRAVYYKDEDGCWYWQKGIDFQLSRNFWTSEFECRCNYPTCKVQKIKGSLVRKLQDIRTELNAPVSVSSAFRCSDYQDYLRNAGYPTATGTSTHERGEAADVRSQDMEALKKLLETRFRSLGYARTFFHVDERSDKLRRWTYTF